MQVPLNPAAQVDVDQRPWNRDCHCSYRECEPPPYVKACCQACCLPSVLCCVTYVFLGLVIGAEIVAWNRVSDCGAQHASGVEPWGEVIPNSTVSQKQLAWTNFLWNQVNVFDATTSNATAIGYWTDADILFGLASKYAYTQKLHGDGGEHVLIQAERPWGFYFGKRYKLWSCTGAKPEYMIEEDFWNEPWFQFFNRQQIFKIIRADTGDVVGISNHTLNNVWSWRGSHWSADVFTANGTHVATLSQETSSQAGWFVHPHWFNNNLRPDLFPNEVVSFLAAVYDIDAGKGGSTSAATATATANGGGGGGGGTVAGIGGGGGGGGQVIWHDAVPRGR